MTIETKRAGNARSRNEKLRSSASAGKGSVKRLQRSRDLKKNARIDQRARAKQKKAEAQDRLERLEKRTKRLFDYFDQVCPVHPPAQGVKTSGKKPVGSRGFNSAARSFPEFQKLVAGMVNYGHGLPTGEANDLLVLDVDKGGEAILSRLSATYGSLPPTVELTSGSGGRHLYYRLPQGCTSTKHLGGLDIQANNAFVVTVGSRHHSGGVYKWVPGKSPDKIKIAELPTRWQQFLLELQPMRPKGDRGEMVFEGNRDNHLTSIGTSMANRGLKGDKLVAALRKENLARCCPPLDDETVVEIAGKREAKIASEEGGEITPENLLTAFLADKYRNGSRLRFEADSQYYRYRRGLWSTVRREVLEGEVQEFLRQSPKAPKRQLTAFVNEMMTLLRREVVAKDDLLHFNTRAASIINVANGEIWLEDDGTYELRKHSSKSGSRTQLNVEYDPDATCPEYDRALLEIFGKAREPKAQVKLWHELVGWIIQGRRNIALIVILFGTGANGKTKVIETIRRLMGEAAVFSASVHELGKNRFAVGYLHGKLLFVDDDVELGIRLPDGILKKISEEKVLTGEIKHGQMFEFRSGVVPVMLCNNVPNLPDLSQGMLRRLLVFDFQQRFVGEDDDKELFPRIWAIEMPGILNRALKGWARVQRNGGFSITRDNREARERWLSQANPLKAFVEEECVQAADKSVLLQALYDHYVDWASRSGITRKLQKARFKTLLDNLGFGCKKSNRGQAVMGLVARKMLD